MNEELLKRVANCAPKEMDARLLAFPQRSDVTFFNYDWSPTLSMHRDDIGNGAAILAMLWALEDARWWWKMYYGGPFRMECWNDAGRSYKAESHTSKSEIVAECFCQVFEAIDR